jgi:circadian clock protein KaiB
MSEQASTDSSASFEKALDESKDARYILRLYVSGSTPRSSAAILNLRKICDECLPGRYQLEVVDIYQQPELAQEDDIIATPTLVKQLPLPVRKLIGDLSKEERIKVGLDLFKGQE